MNDRTEGADISHENKTAAESWAIDELSQPAEPVSGVPELGARYEELEDKLLGAMNQAVGFAKQIRVVHRDADDLCRAIQIQALKRREWKARGNTPENIRLFVKGESWNCHRSPYMRNYEMYGFEEGDNLEFWKCTDKDEKEFLLFSHCIKSDPVDHIVKPLTDDFCAGLNLLYEDFWDCYRLKVYFGEQETVIKNVERRFHADHKLYKGIEPMSGKERAEVAVEKGIGAKIRKALANVKTLLGEFTALPGAQQIQMAVMLILAVGFLSGRLINNPAADSAEPNEARESAIAADYSGMDETCVKHPETEKNPNAVMAHSSYNVGRIASVNVFSQPEPPQNSAAAASYAVAPEDRSTLQGQSGGDMAKSRPGNNEDAGWLSVLMSTLTGDFEDTVKNRKSKEAEASSQTCRKSDNRNLFKYGTGDCSGAVDTEKVE